MYLKSTSSACQAKDGIMYNFRKYSVEWKSHFLQELPINIVFLMWRISIVWNKGLVASHF